MKRKIKSQDQNLSDNTSKTISKRIIVIGASGVGKTTLVEALTPLLALPVIPELGRKLCLEMGFQYPGEIPDQELFKCKVLEEQINQENKLENFVSDRSTVDAWVLWQRWNLCQAMTYDSEGYYQKARQQSALYTDIIYIPPMFEPSDDGFRWTDLDYQKQIDRLVRMTLYDWQLLDRTLTITSLAHQERLKEAHTWLENRL
ncbi:hypothetical protein BH11CYA1_BH11CYA1_03790 [soil metagenome]